MKVEVNEQTQLFYLAFEKWTAAAGHEIRVGNYRFCAIPMKKCVNISEVTTGSRVVEIPMSLEVKIATIRKKDAIKFFEQVGEMILKPLIERTSNFDDQLEKQLKKAVDRLGEMPPIEDVEIEQNKKFLRRNLYEH